MSVSITQENRSLKLYGPLAVDDLIVTDFSGTESLSVPFSYQIDCISPLPSIPPADLLGKDLTVEIVSTGGNREWSGIVKSFEPGGSFLHGYRRYRLEMVPKLWLLSLRTNLRIFQEVGLESILGTILDEYGISDRDFGGLSGTHPDRSYCVQYRESDLDFISRLMQEEGVFFRFEHANRKHTVKFGDSPNAYGQTEPATVRYWPNRSGSAVFNWTMHHEHRSGKFELRDYDFEKVSIPVAKEKTLFKVQSFAQEVYDYPGRFVDQKLGDALVGALIEAHEAGHSVAEGDSSFITFNPGAKFKLTEHPDKSQNASYVLTSVHHTAFDHSQLAAEVGSGGSDYENGFTCIPAERIARPERFTPRPIVAGPHTAEVVGPKGEEIFTDSYGRVKVQFHWDREGKFDDKSSCWVRVGTPIAGNKWGMIHIPRIGQEVIVDFLEGDPDKPLIVGSVWNKQNMPPYALPANKTQSGYKSRSSTKGGAEDFNELRFEDKKGSEQVYFHAQKDFERFVENDDKLTVGRDRSCKIERDENYVIVRNLETKIDGKEDRTVKGNQTVVVGPGGNYSLNVKTGKADIEAKQKITLKCFMSKITMTPNKITLKCGLSSIVLTPTEITIKSMQVKITGNVTAEMTSLMTKVSGSAMCKVKGGIVMIN